jgi:hypothetical protein
MIQAEKYTPETSYQHALAGRQVHLSQVARDPRLWPTPRALMGSATALSREGRTCLEWEAAHRMFPTPTARDHRFPNRNGNFTDQLPNVIGGQLNPTWVEWLMGFPLGWTDLGGSATP